MLKLHENLPATFVILLTDKTTTQIDEQTSGGENSATPK